MIKVDPHLTSKLQSLLILSSQTLHYEEMFVTQELITSLCVKGPGFKPYHVQLKNSSRASFRGMCEVQLHWC